MARHARALVESPYENPYRYWKRARRADLTDKTRWVLLGPLASGARPARCATARNAYSTVWENIGGVRLDGMGDFGP